MSIQKFQYLLHRAEYHKNDKKYFPLWVRRYAESVKVEKGPLAVTLESVMVFSRSLRDHGIPAWQRLQAVRAVEAYRDLVLRTNEPSLAEMRQALQRRAAQGGPGCLQPWAYKRHVVLSLLSTSIGCLEGKPNFGRLFL